MKIGLALGGGGAKGLAHIPLLEAFDELGIRPARIAGASIGAVIGAFYAAGRPAIEIRRDLDEMLFSREESGIELRFDILKGVQLLGQMFDVDFGTGGILKGDRFMSALEDELLVQTFEELQIPLEIVATDFWNREQVVLDSGDLVTAIRASMSLPALFSPVVAGDCVLMDGGAVNPVPYDLLFDDCDLVVAVDVSGMRETPADSAIPSITESIFNTFQIMSKAILDQKLRLRPPDLLLRPDIRDVRVLEFDKAPEIYEQAQAARDELVAWLGALGEK
jgi:NTE family protein